MNQFELSLATPADDAGLRELLATTPMEGDVALAFAREPSYFAASAVDGEFVQVVVARHRNSKRIVGMGSRAISKYFVNGSVQSVGYLSALRIVPEYRGHAGLLMRGYRYFRKLHADGHAAYYLTTIAADNKFAIEVLTSQRAGLPTYHPLGRFHTLTISRSQRVRTKRSNSVSVRAATTEDIQRVLSFFHKVGPRRQFFPSYTGGDDAHWLTRLSELQPDSLLLAFDGNELTGSLGVWDQRQFKQTVVAGYSRGLRFIRLAYNALAPLRGKPRLPRIGQPLEMRYAAVFVVADDRPEIAEALLTAATERLRLAGGEFLIVGMHETDPLLTVARRFGGREFTTLLYAVHWPEEGPNFAELMSRVPYLELGCL
jgi:hypothetical protein